MGHRLTTCTFCGVGCGLYLETSGNTITGAYPSVSHPTNGGKLCIRGWHVHEVASSPDRLKTPLIRRNGRLEPASWDAAYGFIAERLSRIRAEHGPRAIGFLNSPRCSNEESYLLQKFARTVIGTNNVDHGTSVHRARTIEVFAQMLGIPAATSSVGEIQKADVIVVDGIDLARQLPTIAGAVIRARLAGAKVVATGTRRYRHVENADFFVQVKPRSTVCLYGAMAKVIVDRGLMDLKFIKARCRGYEDFLERVQSYDILWAAERCGVSPHLIEEAALTYARASRAMILYASGTEARGNEPIQSIVDLALLTGNVGKEGAGIMPLTEHNNLQGGCDMGMLPEYLPGYAPVGDPVARGRLEDLWEARVPDWPGLDAQSMLGKAGKPAIRALWIARHNAAATALSRVEESIQALDLLVYQHLFLSETSTYAHVVLPLVAFGEERVTFTSTERRIQIAEKAVQPPDGPVPAWRQIVEVANRMGASWIYRSSPQVMDEIGRAVPFYEGASYDNLARDYGRQWPCTNDRPLGTRYLFADETQERPFRFILAERPSLPPGAPPEYPFALTFGYSLYYWHQNVLVKHSETLKREYQILLLDYPEGFVEVSPVDAERLGIRDGARVRLVASTGSAMTYARVTREVKDGMIFVPYFLHDITQQLLGVLGLDEYSPGSQTYVDIEKV